MGTLIRIAVVANYGIKLKLGPENMYTFSIIGHVVNVYKFSRPHFIVCSQKCFEMKWLLLLGMGYEMFVFNIKLSWEIDF